MKQTVLAFSILIFAGLAALGLAFCQPSPANQPVAKQSPAKVEKDTKAAVYSFGLDYPEATVDYSYVRVGKNSSDIKIKKNIFSEKVSLSGNEGTYDKQTFSIDLTDTDEDTDKEKRWEFISEKATVTMRNSSDPVVATFSDPKIFTSTVRTASGKIKMMRITRIYLYNLAERLVDIKDNRRRDGVCIGSVDTTNESNLDKAYPKRIKTVVSRSAEFLAHGVIDGEVGYLNLNEIVAANGIVIRYLRASYGCLGEADSFTVIKQGREFMKNILSFDSI